MGQGSHGRDDVLLPITRNTVRLLRDHGFEVTLEETDGGHTWINWRRYLHQFAQAVFAPPP